MIDFGAKERENATILIDLALREDLGPFCDVEADLTTTATIPTHATGFAEIRTRQDGIIAGLPILKLLAERFDLRCTIHRADGDRIDTGDSIASLSGSMRSLLVVERTALNFLQRLSGIATVTGRYVAAVAGTRSVILDTRKTTPGWRSLEKYAVRCGGGRNHRLGLHDAVMIKDNHLAWLSGRENPIEDAVAAARTHSPGADFVEIEVDTIAQLEHALSARPDIILVDNLGPETLRIAVRMRDDLAPQVLLEASGGVTLSTARALAETGVDRISVGALTHSAPALDLGMDYREPSEA